MKSPGLYTHSIQYKMYFSADDKLLKGISRTTASQSAAKLFQPQSPTRPQTSSVQVWKPKLQGKQPSTHSLLCQQSENLLAGVPWHNSWEKNPGEEKQEGSHTLVLVSCCSSPADCFSISYRARMKIKAPGSFWVATVPLWSYLKRTTTNLLEEAAASWQTQEGCFPKQQDWSSKPEPNLPSESIRIVLKFLSAVTFFLSFSSLKKNPTKHQTNKKPKQSKQNKNKKTPATKTNQPTKTQSFTKQTKPHYPKKMVSCQVPIWIFIENSM